VEEEGSGLRASKDKHEKEVDKSTARSVLDGLVTGPGETKWEPFDRGFEEQHWHLSRNHDTRK
jgi:hypothetical protein